MFKRLLHALNPEYYAPYDMAQKANEDIFWLLNCAKNITISDSDRVLLEQARLALIRVADRYPYGNEY